MRTIAILILTFLIGQTSFAQLRAPNPIEQALTSHGALLSPRASRFLTQLAYVNGQIATHLLVCAKVKIGLYFKTDLGVCSNLLGTSSYFLAGSGLGLTAGVAGEIMTMYATDLTHSPAGDYRGVTIGSSATKGTRIALKIAGLIKNLPKGIGPDFAAFKNQTSSGYLVMLGLQAGPMVDIAGSDVSLYNPTDLLGLPHF